MYVIDKLSIICMGKPSNADDFNENKIKKQDDAARYATI